MLEILADQCEKRSHGESSSVPVEKAVISLDQHNWLPESTKGYLAMTLHRFVSDVSNAVKMKTLDKFFLVPLYPEEEIKISFDYGERMDDRKYQKLVERIIHADKSEKKIALILQEIHSLADLLDIPSDAELYEEEFDLLINMLPLSVFVFLLTQYPNDDFLNRESELLLFQALWKRRQCISSEEEDQVEQAFDIVMR